MRPTGFVDPEFHRLPSFPVFTNPVPPAPGYEGYRAIQYRREGENRRPGSVPLRRLGISPRSTWSQMLTASAALEKSTSSAALRLQTGPEAAGSGRRPIVTEAWRRSWEPTGPAGGSVRRQAAPLSQRPESHAVAARLSATPDDPSNSVLVACPPPPPTGRAFLYLVG